MARMTIVQLRQLANGAVVIMEKLIGRLRCCTSFSRSRRPGGIVPPGSYRTDATAYCHPAPVILDQRLPDRPWIALALGQIHALLNREHSLMVACEGP
jgi:hypothetical protein